MCMTILTEPITLWRGLKSLFSTPKITGHYAVTRSILHGMNLLGEKYNYNPPLEAFVQPVAWVVSGVDTLRYALRLKQKGKIKVLLAGPNISVLPSWDNGVLAHDLVDVCITPASWVQTCYEEDSPSLLGRTAVWPAGVDEDFWQPTVGARRDTVLVYRKSQDAPTTAVFSLLRELGLPFLELAYGNYGAEEYYSALEQVFCAIFLSRSESQGIALAESWAMDVPTLVWNPGVLQLRERAVSVSAAPYLTRETGAFWLEMSELRRLLLECQDGSGQYTPRAWVLREMTDYVCARKFQTMLRTKRRV